MGNIVYWLQENAPKAAFVSLMADYGTPEFYSEFFLKGRTAEVIRHVYANYMTGV